MRTLMEYQNSPVLRLGLIRQAINSGIHIPGAGEPGATTEAYYVFQACDLNNTLLFYNGMGFNTGNIVGTHALYAKLRLLNATTIAATKMTPDDPSDCYFSLLEFFPGVIKSVQRGVNFASSSGGPGLVVLSGTGSDGRPLHPVNPKRAAAYWLGATYVPASGTAVTGGTIVPCRVQLHPAGTHIYVEAPVGAQNNVSASWQIVEW